MNMLNLYFYPTQSYFKSILNVNDLFTLWTCHTRFTNLSLWEIKAFRKTLKKEFPLEHRNSKGEDWHNRFTFCPAGHEQLTSGPLFCSPTVGVGVGISTGGASVTTFLGH